MNKKLSIIAVATVCIIITGFAIAFSMQLIVGSQHRSATISLDAESENGQITGFYLTNMDPGLHYDHSISGDIGDFSLNVTYYIGTPDESQVMARSGSLEIPVDGLKVGETKFVNFNITETASMHYYLRYKSGSYDLIDADPLGSTRVGHIQVFVVPIN